MPIFDYKLLFSEAQDIETSEYSTNELDFGETAPNLGAGTQLVVKFLVTTAFVGGTSVQFKLCHGAATSPTTVIMETPAIVTASLTKGAYVTEIKIPDEHLRYMRIYYVVVGTFTAGAITAFVDTL